MIALALARDNGGPRIRTHIVDPDRAARIAAYRFRAGVRNLPRPEPHRSAHGQRAKSDVLWMNVFSFEMFTLPKPVVASQPAFAL